jgi:hypothetical protein
LIGKRFSTNVTEIADILQQRLKSSRNIKSVREDPTWKVHFDERTHKNNRRIDVRLSILLLVYRLLFKLIFICRKCIDVPKHINFSDWQKKWNKFPNLIQMN